MTRKEEIEKGLKYFKENLHRLSSLYKQMYDEDICFTCPNKKGNIEYAYNKMYNDRNRVFPTIKMRRGCLIDTTISEDPEIPKGQFTRHNITDDIAKILISKGYGSKFIL